MYIVAIGWMFVVVCMAATEATTSSIAGGLVTLLIYGLLPLALLLWLVGTPQRRRDREGPRRVIAGESFRPRRADERDERDERDE